MKSKLLILLIFAGGLFGACTDKLDAKSDPPSDLIPYDTMISIMVDLRLMDAALVQKQREGNGKYNDLKYYLYNSILNKYHISREQFNSSFDYYENDLGVLDKMFAEAITRLTKMKNEVEHEEE